jgi:hypothetical protein
MNGKFKVLIGNEVKKYTNYDDIPPQIDEVIQCQFDYPEPPHTDEQHEEMETYIPKMNELLERSKNGN